MHPFKKIHSQIVLFRKNTHNMNNEFKIHIYILYVNFEFIIFEEMHEIQRNPKEKKL